MAIAILEFVVCAVVIIVAGSFLTRSADVLADATGFGRLLVGSILLAGATSLPELSVGISAARQGWIDLTMGDLVGAGLFNLLTLAMVDLSHHSKGRLLSRLSAAHALSATASIAMMAIVALGVLLASQGFDYSVAGMGIATWAILFAYLLGVRMIYYDQQVSKQAAEAAGGETAKLAKGVLTRALAGFAISALCIVVAAPVFAHAAERIAELSGLGRTFVGTTLVALCTTLPELVATLTAIRLGAFDLAIGNIFGSNAFNLFLLAPVDLAFPGSIWSAVSPKHALTSLAVIIVSAVAVMGQLYQVERRRKFIEPDAVLMLLLISGAIALLYAIR